MPAIEEEAEAFAGVLDPGDELFAALKAWLRREHGIAVKVLPVSAMPNWRRRYDRHSQRLFLSERLSPFDQLREVAMEACLIRMATAIAAEIEALKLSSDEARRLARFELGRYAAHALMMPYAAFQHGGDARALRHRRAALALRRVVRAGGQPADHASDGRQRRRAVLHAGGRQCRKPHPPRRRARLSAGRFGGGCPKLPVHAAFAQPGQMFVEAVEMPDGAAFLTHRAHARRAAGRVRRAPAPHRAAARLRHRLPRRDRLRRSTSRCSGLAGKSPGSSTPVGPACRLCERAGCLSRAEPPVTRRSASTKW